MLGLCITPDFFPTHDERSELNTPYYRSIIYRISDVQELLDLQVPLILTINNQCAEVGGDWNGWNDTIYQICELLKTQRKTHMVPVIGCGNEFDLYYMENKSVPPEFGADIARRAARIAHQYGIKVSATSLASAIWPTYLEHLARLCRDDIDYFDIHPYGQRPNGWKDGQNWMHGDLQNLVTNARNIAQRPIIITEYGVKIRDAGNEQEVANFLRAADTHLSNLDVPYKCWFAYTDLVGMPHERGLDAFGLKSEHEVKRPAWTTFTQVNMSNKPKEDIYVKWGSKVGRGLLDMMKADQTEPAMSSEWRPFDRPSGTTATIEQCIGLNNVTYCWNLNTSSGWRIRPS